MNNFPEDFLLLPYLTTMRGMRLWLAVAVCLSALVRAQMYENTTPNPDWDGETTVDCLGFPDVLSYHFHITYMFKTDQVNSAIDLRDRSQEYFAPFLGEDPICQGTPHDRSGRFDNGRICMIYDHDVTNTTLGPFAVGEWSMFVPVAYYQAVLPWFLMNRGDLSLLVHPNTGCEYEDHSIRAQWSGQPWQMYLGCCEAGTQTVEFGERLGTERNPVCLAPGNICGFGDPQSSGYGPQVVCCSGATCDCPEGGSQCTCVKL
jgi:aromatic ring-cleaving dioxygenase